MDPLPVEVERFIAEHIESLAQLETLLLVRQEQDHSWSCDALAKRLYVPESDCGLIVTDLERRGFVRRISDADRPFQYAPVNPEADRLIGELAVVYQQRRVAVITQIYSKPIRKVQTFADAFRFRKEQ